MKRVLRIFFVSLLTLETIGVLGFLSEPADFTWLGLILTAAMAWLLLEKLKAPLWIWSFAIVALVFDTASALFMLYSNISWWDHPMHFLGGSVIAAGGYEVFSRFIQDSKRKIRSPKIVLGISVFMFVVTIGFFYEFLEYLIDFYYYKSDKTLVSARNSIIDQLWNIVGGTAMFLALEIKSLWARRPVFRIRTAYASKGIKNPA